MRVRKLFLRILTNITLNFLFLLRYFSISSEQGTRMPVSWYTIARNIERWKNCRYTRPKTTMVYINGANSAFLLWSVKPKRFFCQRIRTNWELQVKQFKCQKCEKTLVAKSRLISVKNLMGWERDVSQVVKWSTGNQRNLVLFLTRKWKFIELEIRTNLRLFLKKASWTYGTLIESLSNADSQRPRKVFISYNELPLIGVKCQNGTGRW